MNKIVIGIKGGSIDIEDVDKIKLFLSTLTDISNNKIIDPPNYRSVIGEDNYIIIRPLYETIGGAGTYSVVGGKGYLYEADLVIYIIDDVIRIVKNRYRDLPDILTGTNIISYLRDKKLDELI